MNFPAPAFVALFSKHGLWLRKTNMMDAEVGLVA